MTIQTYSGLLRRYLPIILTVSIGTFLSVMLYQFSLSREAQRLKYDFNKAAEDRTSAVQRTLDFNHQLLQTTATMLNSNQDELNEARFKVFADPVLKRYSYLEALLWVAVVPHDQRTDFEAAQQKTRPDFAIRETVEVTDHPTSPNGADNSLPIPTLVPAAERAVYYPVQYMAPFINSSDTLGMGLDLAYYPNLLETLEKARDSGTVQIISHIALLEGSHLYGLLAVLPIYRSDMPQKTSEQRREALLGFTAALYEIGAVLDQTIMDYLKPRSIDVKVYDVTDPSQPGFLYYYPGELGDDSLYEMTEDELEQEIVYTDLVFSTTFTIGGRIWEVVCTPAPGYHLRQGISHWAGMSELLLGLLLTALLAAYFYKAMHHVYHVAEMAEASNEAQSRSLANMSHQFRTPLNAILGYCELLREDAEDSGDTVLCSDLEKIHVSARYLLSLSEGVLDLSRIKVGRIELNYADCDIQTRLDEVRSIALPLLKRYDNTLDIQCPADIGSLWTDGTRLDQILLNLLNNLSEHTQKEHIFMEVFRLRQQGKHWMCFVIRGHMTGGLNVEQRTHLLSKLAHIAGSKTDNDPEIRMGLIISAHLWHLLGGYLDIETDPEKGISFILYLPVQTSEATAVSTS